MTDVPQNLPRILAIETSSRHGSVLLAEGPNVLTHTELPESNRHATALMPAILDMMRTLDWQPASLHHTYLSLGPGSFTGLRIAVALARSLAQALHTKLVGVPSLEVIAHNALPHVAAHVTPPIILPILDAKRAQVFSARYRFTNIAASMEILTPPALVDPRTFIEETRSLFPGTPILLLGEGLDYHQPALAEAAGPDITQLPPNDWFPRATFVHQLGYRAVSQNHFADPHKLLPIYIRLPEAEEVWRKKHNVPLDVP